MITRQTNSVSQLLKLFRLKLFSNFITELQEIAHQYDVALGKETNVSEPLETVNSQFQN
jgi:hypothetical protein